MTPDEAQVLRAVAEAGELPASFSPSLLKDFDPSGTSFDESLDLFIGGRGLDASASMDLVLWNEQLVKSLSLFIQGAGLIPNALPMSATLNLELRRDPSEALDLYISGPDAYNNYLNLFIEGVAHIGTSLNLVMPNVEDKPNATLALFISGY